MPIELLAVGRVLRPHGVRGDLLLETLTDFPQHLAEVDTVYLGEPPVAHPLAAARVHRGQLILRLADVPDRDAADAFRGQLVQIKAVAAAPLPPGTYYHHQLLGLPVVTEAGEPLGELAEVLETGANDVYVVQGPGGELLLPAIRSVILSIDLAARQITVRVPAGLRDA
jgi:16S rRNA processing protein RimM